MVCSVRKTGTMRLSGVVVHTIVHWKIGRGESMMLLDSELRMRGCIARK